MQQIEIAHSHSEIREQILRLKSEGRSYASIGMVFGFSRQRAQQYLVPKLSTIGVCKQCGFKGNSLHRHHADYATNIIELLCNSCHSRELWREKHEQNILFLINSPNLTLREAEDKLKISYTALIRAAKAINYKFRKQQLPKHGRLWKVLDWGQPLKQIAQTFGVSYTSVWWFLRKYPEIKAMRLEATKNPPIDTMIDDCGLRCTKCLQSKCNCWEQCSCGWSAERGTVCTNPNTRACSLKVKYGKYNRKTKAYN